MNTSLKRIKAEIEVLGDKSISHRALMIASISRGVTKINNLLFSQDSISTLNCLRNLGVKIEVEGKNVFVYGSGLFSFKAYNGTLYAGNSGTTMRLLSGILSGYKFKSIIDGDSSLRKRPMDRIIKPLSLMGADIYAENSGIYSPVHISGGNLKSISYEMEINSAQVKSSILFAGLHLDSTTTIIEKIKTRNHTEIMLKYFGANISFENGIITISSNELYSNDIFIPGDISSASFFVALAGSIFESELVIKNVGINETRIGFLHVFKKMGIRFEFLNVRENYHEKICDLKVYGTNKLNPVSVEGDIIPSLIDEIPIICVLCCFAEGQSIIRDIGELRYKESDRIKSIVREFRKLDIDICEIENGIKIIGGKKIKASKVNSYNDHRIAMALTVLRYLSGEDIVIENRNCVDVSFPSFYKIFDKILK